MSLTAPFTDKHPDFTSKLGRLSMRDFRTLCKREGIVVQHIPKLKLGGFIFWTQGKPFIVLRRLDPFVAFHELGHYFGWKDEDRADAFAEACTGIGRNQ